MEKSDLDVLQFMELSMHLELTSIQQPGSSKESPNSVMDSHLGKQFSSEKLKWKLHKSEQSWKSSQRSTKAMPITWSPKTATISAMTLVLDWPVIQSQVGLIASQGSVRFLPRHCRLQSYIWLIFSVMINAIIVVHYLKISVLYFGLSYLFFP